LEDNRLYTSTLQKWQKICASSYHSTPNKICDRLYRCCFYFEQSQEEEKTLFGFK